MAQEAPIVATRPAFINFMLSRVVPTLSFIIPDEVLMAISSHTLFPPRFLARIDERSVGRGAKAWWKCNGGSEGPNRGTDPAWGAETVKWNELVFVPRPSARVGCQFTKCSVQGPIFSLPRRTPSTTHRLQPLEVRSSMLQEIVQQLTAGVEIEFPSGAAIIVATTVSRGRLANAVSIALSIDDGTQRSALGYASIFHGRKPYYHPWVELFGLDPTVELRGEPTAYFNSPFEARLLDLFSAPLGPGGKLYVEYAADRETDYGLMRSFPVTATRLGYELFGRDFTWFKDWYHPEGFFEGGQKLQGEKPLEERREKHISSIIDALESFVGRADRYDAHEYFDNAYERAERLISQLSASNGD